MIMHLQGTLAHWTIYEQRQEAPKLEPLANPIAESSSSAHAALPVPYTCRESLPATCGWSRRSPGT